ncbi:MAG: hypothetical protein NTY53_09430 [Kiritimatiellaeota bacterium]|nr:hypothetical protein [Kiritimatiellota bacterium]
MKTRYLLLGMTALYSVAGCSWCRAQTPPTHLPAPIIVAPKPMALKPAPVVVNTNVAKPAVVWCPACRGRKTVGVEVEGPCRSCNGTGKIVSGFAKTEAACNFCKGSGKVINLVPQPCPVCQAKGTLASAVVEQFIACTNCNGTKVLEIETSTGGGSFAGGSSGGKSGASMGSSLSANVATQELPCPFCNATGKIDKKVKKACPVCYGAGIVPPPPPPPQPSAGG